MKALAIFFSEHRGVRWTIQSSMKVLAWFGFFCFEYLAMALLQLSVYFSNQMRDILLLCGLLLSGFFIYFGMDTLNASKQSVKGFLKRLSPKNIVWPTKSEFAYIAAIYIISLAGMMSWQVFENFFLSKITSGTTENQAALDSMMSFGGRYSIIVLSLIIVFLGPIMEELVFRGLFFHYFNWKRAPWVTIIASGLLFGLYHLGSYTWLSLLDLPPYLIIGTGLAYAYSYTNKLSSSILMHIFHNGWVQVMSLMVLIH
ncbi:CAAX protease self-immunity [Fructobacillus durionis]|uniref:CAAX protease self-immunity n=2 Tax=Fructobacillus durionis TaxID=283737 RepID=A0A1I1GCN1_9LACO|nr:CAAX protease self-immunity [Fructobacillus durionis]